MTSGAAARTDPLIRSAGPGDLARVREILNNEIRSSTASWTTMPKSPQDMSDWLAARQAGGFPVLVAECGRDGGIAGYASYGPFRSGEGYHATVEHSVYVDEACRRAGIARCLMEALIEHARAAGKRLMIGGISGEAADSLEFHRRMGFSEVGRIPGAGRKFGRTLDLVLMSLALGDDAPR